MSVRRWSRKLVVAVTAILLTAGVLIGALLPSVPGAGASISSALNPAQPPRNIILICMDTVRFDSFSLPETTGHPDVFTPWIGEAIDFTDATSVSSWTIPSVASVFTGLYPQQHAAGSFAEVPSNLSRMTPSVLSGEAVTFPEVLRGNKYLTYAITASPFISETTGLLKGIDRFEVVKNPGVASHAVLWLRQQAASPSPWFLYLHFMDAHGDHVQGVPALEQFASELPEGLREATIRSAPAGICKDRQETECLSYQAYVHSLTRLRKQLALVLATLEETGQSEHTLVVLFSDHGEEFHEHRQAEMAIAGDPRPFYGEGHGQSMFRELLHVPVLVWHPGIPPRVSAAPISLVDLAPSILSWVEAPPLPAQAGRTLDARATRRSLPENRMRFASGIAYGYPEQSVKWNDWKLVQVGCVDRQFLFDHRVDPEELHPVRNSEVERVLGRSLARYDNLPSLRRVASTFSDEQMKSLRSLGYLQGGSSTAALQCPGSRSIPAASGLSAVTED